MHRKNFMSKKGILLVNLGTPDSPETKDVRKYLDEFLMDPRVIDINPVSRALLVKGIIVPFRSPKTSICAQVPRSGSRFPTFLDHPIVLESV